MGDAAILPESFSFLDSWSEWIISDEVRRREKCAATPLTEIQNFYTAILESADSILEYLNSFPLEQLPEPERNLFFLMQSFIEASLSVEMFEQPEMDYAMSIKRFQPIHHEVP